MSDIKNSFDCENDIGFQVVCGACAEVFYDLKQTDPQCPHCHISYSKGQVNKKRKTDQSYMLEGIKDEFDEDSDDGIIEDEPSDVI